MYKGLMRTPGVLRDVGEKRAKDTMLTYPDDNGLVVHDDEQDDTARNQANIFSAVACETDKKDADIENNDRFIYVKHYPVHVNNLIYFESLKHIG